MKNNFIHTFNLFLKEIKAPVTKTSASRFLENHPDEGSMLAYADALSHFKIENAAIRIDAEQLQTLPTPFIAFSQIHGGTFSVVKNLTDNTIEWFDIQKGWVNDKLEEFTKVWSGVVLLAEKNELSGEKNFVLNRRNEILRNLRIPIAVSLISVIFLYFIFLAPSQTLATYSLLGLKIIGLIISSLLFVKSIDNANRLVNKLCNAGTKISCQSILDSPAAKITPWFSWSDAGFIYFFGSFLGVLFALYDDGLNAYWTVQLVFSGLALLFSTYSLYYQGVRAKMWCTLCLGVVSVFFLEALLVFTNLENTNFESYYLIKIAVGFIIPIAFLLLFKALSIRAQESISLKKELSKLKSNPQIFEALMAGQKQMPEIPTDMPIIKFGNKNAEHTITMVSNPLCTPCARIHVRIEKLLAENENLKCEIIFISNTDEDNAGGKFVRKLFSLPESKQADGLHTWFSRNDKNFEKWNAAYSQYENGDQINRIQAQHLNWTNTAEVQATPTLFINGKMLPSMIKLEDLAFQDLTPST